MSLSYTTIQHAYRKAHDLSMNEYALCDMIYHLSTKPNSSVPGWCYMSKTCMGKEIGCTKQGILNMINRLISGGFIIKNEETKYLKTSEKWQKVYDIGSGKESLPTVKKLDLCGKQSLPDGGKQSLPNNNTIDNNNYKGSDQADIFDPLLKESEEIFSEAGMDGVFFSKVQKIYGIDGVQVRTIYRAWRKEHEAVGTEFRSKQHLKNSFNRFVKQSKSGGKTIDHPVTRVKAGKMIG